MSTLRQIEANRRNAQKSTGPVSVTGKAASSINALKSGVHAESLVLPSENLADLEQLIDEYHQRHTPTSPEARLFVDELVHCEWMLRRLRTVETELWRYKSEDVYCDREKNSLGKAAAGSPVAFSKLQYRVDSIRRAYHRALQALEKLKAEAAAPAPAPEPAQPVAAPPLTPSPQSTSPQIGFVPSTPLQPASVEPLPTPTPAPDARLKRLRIAPSRPCPFM